MFLFVGYDVTSTLISTAGIGTAEWGIGLSKEGRMEGEGRRRRTATLLNIICIDNPSRPSGPSGSSLSIMSH